MYSHRFSATALAANFETEVLLRYSGHFRIQEKLCPVGMGILRQCHTVQERIGDAGMRRPERRLAAMHLIWSGVSGNPQRFCFRQCLRCLPGRPQQPPHILLPKQLLQPLPFQDLQVPAAVLPALGQQLLQPLLVFLIKGNHQLPSLTEGHVQIPAQRLEPLVSLYAKAGHPAARTVIEARMHDGGITPGGLSGNIAVLLQHGDTQIIAGQFPGDRAADGTGANYNNIVVLVHLSIVPCDTHSPSRYKGRSCWEY